VAGDRGQPEEVDREHRLREDRRLLSSFHRERDPAQREALVRRFMPLAHRLARRYRRGDEPLDDLQQVAAIGLIHAIDRFDPSQGAAFSSFAVPTILGELKRHFRDVGWAVRVPRDLQERALRVNRAVAGLTVELGRSPTPGEIAQRTDASVEDVLEALDTLGAAQARSFDEPREGDEEGEATTLASRLGGPDPGFARAEDAATLERLARTLTRREREVLRLRFVEDLTQSEIGERLGMSQMHASRLIRQSLERLRDAAGNPEQG